MSQEEAILRAAREGDRQAAEEILARHEDEIYRFGLRMCGNEQDARDVLQETMLTAFRGVGEFRGDASLSTWLYRIARSFCSRSRRGSMERAPTVPVGAAEATLLQDPAALPDASAHAREIGDVLRAAIQALPEGQREVVVLRDLEGLSAEQAAEVLGIQVAALKSRLHRARMELRRSLAAALGEPEQEAPCPALAEEIAGRAPAEIDTSACARIEEHMATCPRCAGAREGLRRNLLLCRAAGGDVPAPVRAAVWAAIRADGP